MARPRWTFTVFSAVPSSAAICLFNMPVITSCITSNSRGVSLSMRACASRLSPRLCRYSLPRPKAGLTASINSPLSKDLSRPAQQPRDDDSGQDAN